MKKSNPIHIKKKNEGALHKQLDVKQGEPIPEVKLLRAMKMGTPLEKKRAVFANNAKGWNHSK